MKPIVKYDVHAKLEYVKNKKYYVLYEDDELGRQTDHTFYMLSNYIPLRKLEGKLIAVYMGNGNKAEGILKVRYKSNFRSFTECKEEIPYIKYKSPIGDIDIILTKGNVIEILD